MITKEEVQQAYQKISSYRIARIGDSIHGLFLQPVDFGTKLHLSALVYAGDKFIPYSVRKAATLPLLYSPPIRTWLAINEERFEIYLHFLGPIDPMDEHTLHELTSQFEETAILWRQIFEERDRQDLVHVHQSR